MAIDAASANRSPARERSAPELGGSQRAAPIAGGQPVPDECALHVEGVVRRFGRQSALRGVSFRVLAGERVALLGPNGAGKTTLVRTICGRVRPDAGRVLLFGHSVRDSKSKPMLGVVPQEIAVYPDLSARENLRVFGRLHGLRGPQLQQRVDQLLEWIGLADRAGQLVGTFSGGMKRRVNIACGVLHRPRILLLDEPTVGVDPQSRQRIFEMLDQLWADGTALVLTTHHLEEAEAHSDRIVIIDHGQVIAEGNLEQLIEATVGPQKQLAVRLKAVPIDLPAGLRWDPKQQLVVGPIDDVASQLPLLLQRLEQLGGQVEDVQLLAPNLHHVFLHLTGRELRE
jgi:ABC-2 type transport system ATP-binding protein